MSNRIEGAVPTGGDDDLRSYYKGLSLAYPPRAVVYVGMGTDESGLLPALLPLEVPVHVVEADAAAIESAQLAHGNVPLVRLHHAVVAGEASLATYFQYRPESASGVLGPEQMALYWRNLRLVSERQVDTQTLDRVIAAIDDEAAHGMWLIIDCLPAAGILKGAANLLSGTTVVILREGRPLGGNEADQDSLTRSLVKAAGFRRACILQTRLPSFHRCVYVPDHESQLVQSQDKIASLEGSIAQLDRERSENASRVELDMRALRIRNHELEAKLADCELELERRARHIETVDRGLEEASIREREHVRLHEASAESAKRAESELEELTGTLDAVKRDLGRLLEEAEDRNRAHEITKQDLEARNALIVGEADQLRTLLAQLVSDREQLTGLLGDARSESDRYRAQLAQSTLEANSAAAEVLVLSQRERDQRSLRDEAEARAVELKRLHDELGLSKEALKLRLDEALEKIGSLGEQEAASAREIVALRSEVENLTRRLGESEEMRRQDEARFLEERTTQSADLERLQSALSEATTKVESERAACEVVTAQLDDLREQLAAALRERDMVVSGAARAHDAVEEDQRELETLKRQVAEMLGRETAIDSQISSAQTQLRLLLDVFAQGVMAR